MVRELKSAVFEAQRLRLKEPTKAAALSRKAVAGFRQEGQPDRLAFGLLVQGQIDRDAGNIEAAIAAYRESAELSQIGAKPKRVAHALRHLADLLRERGDATASLEVYSQALGIYRGLSSPTPNSLANTLRGLALAEEATGRREEAERHWREAMDIYQARGINAGVTECREHLA